MEEQFLMIVIFLIWGFINVGIAAARGANNPWHALLWSLLTPLAGLIYALVAKTKRRVKQENANRL